MPTDAENNRVRPEPYSRSSHGTIYFQPRGHSDRRSVAAAPATLPNPLIGPRPRRPHSIHIISYPAGFIPRDLRPIVAPQPDDQEVDRRKKPKSKKKKKKKSDKSNRRSRQDKGQEFEKRRSSSVREKQGKASRVLHKILSLFGTRPGSRSKSAESDPELTRTPRVTVQPRSRPVSLLSIGRQLTRLGEFPGTVDEVSGSMRPVSTVEQALRPSSLIVAGAPGSNRNSMLSATSRSVGIGKSIVNSTVTEISKPVASGSGVNCSILLAEPYIFLSGFEHEGHSRESTHSGTALLRGKLVLNVSKNVKLKSITLKLVGKARTEWPEGIPPLKVDLFEEQSLRTQGLTFFHAMHDGWETEYGNQCVYSLKAANDSSARPSLGRSSPAGSNISVNTFLRSGRASSNLTTKELKRLSLQSVQSRSFGKGDCPLPNQVQLKGYKVFVPGTYEYSFELPIDHHQLETTKLQYGSVKWQLETIIERAGAFRPNLQGAKEVNIVRVPDQLSLEMSEPISISRQWEDQLHYDIMISGKSFPIGSKIPIAFKLTPLAKVQVHKIKVFVTESIEYWTNDRRVTRKDMGRKILLLEKAAGKPVDRQFSNSEIRVVRGGELSPSQREGARAAATRRRTIEAQRTRGVAEPLPEPTENILGDLDLGLESYWASTEMEMNVQIPTCEMMAKDRTLKLHPDCSWKNVNVFHWIKIVMRISRADPDDPANKRRRHFEISIDSPFTVLNCRATQANTALPQYSGMDVPAPSRAPASCGCWDAQREGPSPSSSTGTLPITEDPNAETVLSGALSSSPATTVGPTPPALPITPQAAHLPTVSPGIGVVAGMGTSPSSRPSTSGRFSSASGLGLTNATPGPSDPIQRVRHPQTFPQRQQSPRPIHLIRVPSYNPPPFDADEPPPQLAALALAPSSTTTADGSGIAEQHAVLMTPPPNYDLIVGTPSVDGLADYFARLADYEDDNDAATITGADSSDDGPSPLGEEAASQLQPPASDTTTTTAATTAAATTTGSSASTSTTTPTSQTPDAQSQQPQQQQHQDAQRPGRRRRPSLLRPSSSLSDSSDDEDDDEEDTAGPTRLTERSGRVNVANPRTPGGRNVPSRSFDIARPVVQLSMDGVVRRGEGRVR